MADTSFLAQALIPTQQTAAAVEAFEGVGTRDGQFAVSVAAMLEFLSLLRSYRQSSFAHLGGSGGRGLVVTLTAGAFVESPGFLLERAWEVATQLGQSDVFDAYGFATPEWIDCDFWTSHRRFCNAAQAAQLERVRLID